MTIYFMDTSAIAKRYLPTEIGAGWVRQMVKTTSKNKIVIADLTLAEMTSLLMRRQRENSLTSSQVRRALHLFYAHTRTEYTLINLDITRIKRARRLLIKHPLRALDALQLSCAIESRLSLRAPIMFVSADLKLLGFATSEGFQVDNPLLHP